MELMELLQQYLGSTPPSDAAMTSSHFDEAARAAPPDVFAHGVSQAFRSDQTPPFSQIVGQLFGQSNPNQRAGVLNQLLNSIAPGVLASLSGGALGNSIGQSESNVPQVTPTQATQLTPQQAQEIAAHAEQNDPGIVEKLGDFYSAHPDLVKNLGGAVLTVALASMANRMRHGA